MTDHDLSGSPREIPTHRWKDTPGGTRRRASLLPFAAVVVLVISAGVVAQSVLNRPDTVVRGPFPPGSPRPTADGVSGSGPVPTVGLSFVESTAFAQPSTNIAVARSPATTVASPRAVSPATGAPGPAGTVALPSFTPVTVQAEHGTLTGTAAAKACATCAGGSRVAYIDYASTVVVRADLTASGTRTIRVTYETEGRRQLKTKVNDGAVDVRWLDGSGWETPRTFDLVMSLPMGPVRLTFYNDASAAPDVDQVSIS